MDPIVLQDVAKVFPDVSFVVAHFGCGYPGEPLHLCWANRKVYVDTSSSHKWLWWMPFGLTPKDTFRKWLETAGRTDPVREDSCDFRCYVGTYADEQVQTCREVGLSFEDLRLVFAGVPTERTR